MSQQEALTPGLGRHTLPGQFAGHHLRLVISGFSVLEQANVIVLNESPISRLAREFTQNAAMAKTRHEIVGGGIRGADQATDVVHRDYRMLIQMLQNAMTITGRAAQILCDNFSVVFAQLENFARCVPESDEHKLVAHPSVTTHDSTPLRVMTVHSCDSAIEAIRKSIVPMRTPVWRSSSNLIAAGSSCGRI